MNKIFKYLIIFVIVFVSLYVLNIYLRKDLKNLIKDYLIDFGYYELSNDNLIKEVSSNVTNEFNLSDYTLMQRIEDNKDNIKTLLNQTYSFKNHSINYNYRIEYSDNINVLFRGSLKGDDFTCEKEFSTASFSDEEKGNTCSLIKIKVLKFFDENEVLFTNYELIKYMENN